MEIKSKLVRKIVETERLKLEELFSSKERLYTFVNPVSYIVAQKNLDSFEAFDGVYADGSVLVRAIKKVYHQRVTRRSFDMTSLAPMLFEHANAHRKSICVVATRQDALEKAIAKLKSSYPDIEWRDCRNGFFASEEEKMEAVGKIVADAPDYLIVGMGALMQEKFLLMCRNAGFKGIGFTCGGFIHQYAENSSRSYYPVWADRLNLRFLYRMYKEPHTRIRYTKAAFVFPYKFIVDRFL